MEEEETEPGEVTQRVREHRDLKPRILLHPAPVLRAPSQF